MNVKGGSENPQSKERVALYMRTSSEEQREKATIETQEAFLEQYGALYSLDVVDSFKDEGISGTVPIHERPEGARLLKSAKSGGLDVVLVYRLDRVGRALLNVVDAHDRLDTLGVALRSATEPIDTSTPSGRLIFHMLASFAEYERGTIRQRTTDGMQRAFKAGRHFGFIPFGYDVDESGKLIVVEEEACIVREIMSNAASGESLYSEAVRLNALGIPSPGRKYRGRPRKPGASWWQSTVRAIVTQGAYSGTHTVRAASGPIERPVPPIVEPRLQQRALDRLKENKRYSGGRPGREYLLRGLIRCKNCNTLYVGASKTNSVGKKYSYYNCRGRLAAYQDKRLAVPDCPSVPAPWIEELVWSDVRRFIESPGEVLQRLREDAEGEGAAEELTERRDELSRRLGDILKEKDRYVRMYAQGHLSEDELADYLQDVDVRSENVRMMLDSAEEELSEKAKSAEHLHSTAQWLTELKGRAKEVEAETEAARATRRELMVLFVESITLETLKRDERDLEPRTDKNVKHRHNKLRAKITYRFGPPEECVSGEQNGTPL